MTRPVVIRLLGALAIAVWLGCAADAVLQKMSVDQSIRDYATSTLQVQQLNGSLTSHLLVLLLVGLGATMPFIAAVGFAIVKRD